MVASVTLNGDTTNSQRPQVPMAFDNDFLKAAVLYLRELNRYSAASSGSSIQDEKLRLLRYNVGGVIVIADVLKASIKESQEKPDVGLNNDELLDLFKKSWYPFSASIDVKPKFKNYFNSAYDPSCTLNYAVAQIIEATINKDENDSFVITVTGLLRHYNNYINEKNQSKVPDAITGYEFMGLFQEFQTNRALKMIEKKEEAKKVLELRKKGNEYFKAGRFGIAVATYTEGILIDSKNYILYSARAAAYTYLQSYDDAIEDLLKSVQIKPDFETSWTRLGFCYLGKGKALDSYKAYINSIKYAHRNKSLKQYILKLIDSLAYAEQRAYSQGISEQELKRLSAPIKPTIEEYTRTTQQAPPPRPSYNGSDRSQTAEGQRTTQPAAQAEGQNLENPLVSVAQTYINNLFSGGNGLFIPIPTTNNRDSPGPDSTTHPSTTNVTPNNDSPAPPAAGSPAPNRPTMEHIHLNHHTNLSETLRNSIGGIITQGLQGAMSSLSNNQRETPQPPTSTTTTLSSQNATNDDQQQPQSSSSDDLINDLD